LEDKDADEEVCFLLFVFLRMVFFVAFVFFCPLRPVALPFLGIVGWCGGVLYDDILVVVSAASSLLSTTEDIVEDSSSTRRGGVLLDPLLLLEAERLLWWRFKGV
jgi:hypothetical protein